MREKTLDGAIAATRFGLGARAGEIEQASSDPRGFLVGQIAARVGPEPAAASSVTRLADFAHYQDVQRDARQAGQGRDGAVKTAAKMIRQTAGADFLARARLGAATPDGFRERWALFWANHFTVSANKLATAALVGPFEAEAIRPNVFGPFERLLVASSSHPAMLLYLDEAVSIGPDSPAAEVAARGGKRVGLNENLAREIMELHTVGIDAYSQADVTEFARAMTGWSVGGRNAPAQNQGRFVFRERAHEPGGRRIMGRRYAEDGQGQALAVLKDLAASPHTARHLSIKLARHFVADDPERTLSVRLERAWIASDGDLGEVARTLIAAPEAWVPEPRKFKTPYEFILSAWRATGSIPDRIEDVAPILTAMGQKPFSASSPKGWPETAQDWCTPDAIIKRMAWSEKVAGLAGDQDPVLVAQASLGARLTPPVARAVARAETRSEGLAILFMSPEFQRR